MSCQVSPHSWPAWWRSSGSTSQHVAVRDRAWDICWSAGVFCGELVLCSEQERMSLGAYLNGWLLRHSYYGYCCYLTNAMSCVDRCTTIQSMLHKLVRDTSQTRLSHLTAYRTVSHLSRAFSQPRMPGLPPCDIVRRHP